MYRSASLCQIESFIPAKYNINRFPSGDTRGKEAPLPCGFCIIISIDYGAEARVSDRKHRNLNYTISENSFGIGRAFAVRIKRFSIRRECRKSFKPSFEKQLSGCHDLMLLHIIDNQSEDSSNTRPVSVIHMEACWYRLTENANIFHGRMPGWNPMRDVCSVFVFSFSIFHRQSAERTGYVHAYGKASYPDSA